MTNLANCLLSNNVSDYYYVAQGKTTIPNVDDGEECLLTDVSGGQLISDWMPTLYYLHFLLLSD